MVAGTAVSAMKVFSRKRSSTNKIHCGHYGSRINSLLRDHPANSPEVLSALKELQRFAPVPPSEVIDASIWGKADLRVNSHIESSTARAISNIEMTGRRVTLADKRYLRLILTHRCGWSATNARHRHDGWVHYVRALFPQVGALVPVLDSLVWPEEVDSYPKGRVPPEPEFFFFATEHSYYVFVLDELSLFRAGSSLAEVYDGLKAGRFHGDKDGDWVAEELCPGFEAWDSRDYFPVYARRNGGKLEQLNELKEFVPD